MSTVRIAIIIGGCLVLGGCVPVTGAKSVVALVISIVAIVGAAMGIIQSNHEDSVFKKARELDETITAHEAEYHQPRAE